MAVGHVDTGILAAMAAIAAVPVAIFLFFILLERWASYSWGYFLLGSAHLEIVPSLDPMLPNRK